MVDRSDEPGTCKSGRARRRIPANGCSFLRVGQGACDIEGHASVLAEKTSPAIRGHGKLAKLVEQLRHSAAEAPCPRFVPGGATLIARSASVGVAIRETLHQAKVAVDGWDLLGASDNPPLTRLASIQSDLYGASPIGIGVSGPLRKGAPGGADEILARPKRGFWILAGENPPFVKERANEAQTPHIPSVFRQLLVKRREIIAGAFKKLA